MRYYLAYKYSKNINKEELKRKLEDLSHKISGWGHETFILGRDVKKWRHVHLGSIKLVPVIYNNMKDCDLLLSYVDSPSFSKGLLFEVLISKLLGKRSIMIIQGGRKSRFFRYFFSKTKNVPNIDQITPDHIA